MKCILGRCLVLLSCALLVCVDAGAAARGPSARESAAMKATKPANARAGTGQQDLEAWLSRLKGSFAITYRVEEKTTCRGLSPGGVSGPQACTTQKAATYVSSADCRGIGQGAGVHCSFEEFRPAQQAEGEPAPAPAFFLSEPLPIRALFGLDPASGKINMTMTSAASVALSALGSLQGNDVSFKGRCDSAVTGRTSTPCTWSFWIQAPPDGRRILMTRTMRGVPHHLELTRMEPSADQ